MDEQSRIQPDNPPLEPTSTPPTSPEALIPNPVPVTSPPPPLQTDIPVTPSADLSEQKSSESPASPSSTPQAQPQVIQPSQNSVYSPPQQTPTFVSQADQASPSAKRSKNKFLVPLILVIIIALAVGGVFAFKGSPSTTKLDCVPSSGSTVSKTLAIAEYKTFAQAIRASNQTCANSLSSSYFIDNAKVTLDAPNGNWITVTPDGLSSWASDFSKLPNSLSNSQFVNKTYTREITETASGSTPSYYKPATGLTVGYPSGNGGTYYLVSFISQNGKILVDNILEGPLSAG